MDVGLPQLGRLRTPLAGDDGVRISDAFALNADLLSFDKALCA